MTAADTNALIDRREAVSRWTPRVLIGLTVVVVLAALYQLRQDPPPLSPKVEAAIVSHEIARVVDSAEITRLRDDAAAEKRKAVAAVARERSAMVAVSTERHRADSLAIVARLADSLTASIGAAVRASDAQRASPPPDVSPWKAAYDARTSAFDKLLVAKAESDSIGTAEHRRAESLETALQRSETVRANGDSLIAQLTAVARSRPPQCRVLPFVPCPSRKAAAVVGVGVGLVGGFVLAGGSLPYPLGRR